MEEAKWYVVHTYSGYENKVQTSIQTTVKNRGLEDVILEVEVPVELVSKSGNEKKGDSEKNCIKRKKLPGYVFVKMVMNDDTWYVVRNTRGVTGFVGPGSKPVPLTEAEMEAMIGKPVITVDFEIGDSIMIIAGPWKDTVGVVQRMDAGKQTATINIEVFGRATPVEIGFGDMQKL